MKRVFKIWLDMGWCCFLVTGFFGGLLVLAELLSPWDLGIIILVASVVGGFASAIIISKHEERINTAYRSKEKRNDLGNRLVLAK